MVDLATLILRFFVAIVMIPHGAHKFHGLNEVNEKWRKEYGFPTGTVAFVGVIQIITGLAIMLGVYTRHAAFIQILVMLAATYVSIWKNREHFLSLPPTGKGWDINVLLLGVFIALTFLGGGKWTLLGG